MKRKLQFTIFILLSFFSVQSQQIPLDFSTNTDNFTGFNGSSFSFRTDSPSSASNRGGQFFNSGSNATQGFYIDLAQAVTLNNDNKIFTLRFYSFDPNNHNILLKLEDAANTNVQVKTTFSVPSSLDWTTVSFDFSNAQNSSNGSTVNATGSYSRITLFIDEGTTTSGTYVIDDITNGTSPEPPTDPNAIDVEYTDLVWADEFDTPGAVNLAKWHHQTQVIIPGVGWANQEEQHYTNRIDNSFVTNGALNIVAKKENYTDQGITKEYTSARLNSKFAFTYGRIEVKAKLPAWEGTWPAIWTLGKNINENGAYWDNQYGTTSWPACGEIDVMEHGLGAVNHTSSAIHTPSSFGNTMNTASQVISDVATNWHIYAVNWSPDQITFLVDGIGFYTYKPSSKSPSTWPFDEDQFILLNLAMGGISGAIDANVSSDTMLVDYVRVYQNLLSSDDFVTESFKIFPNPSSNMINIKGNTRINSIELHNMLGELVLNKKGNVDAINVSEFNPGIYVITIASDTAVESKKVFIN